MFWLEMRFCVFLQGATPVPVISATDPDMWVSTLNEGQVKGAKERLPPPESHPSYDDFVDTFMCLVFYYMKCPLRLQQCCAGLLWAQHLKKAILRKIHCFTLTLA
ncbi:hypothetical protein TRVL_06723 [Trypanosoma vivax]|nr:hypothetical protein TRVL_06723 [Trypanosoma vivax]